MSEENKNIGNVPSTGNIPEEMMAPEPETLNPKPETEMEIHHHSHDGHGEKKSWKTYFWEFLMLFLAVFCGFLAEQQRERLVERHREKQYMESLTRDLILDT